VRVLLVVLGIYSRIGGIERFNQRLVRCLEELHGHLISEAAVISLWDSAEDAPQGVAKVKLIPGRRSKLLTFSAFIQAIIRFRPHVILYGHVLLTPLLPTAKVLRPPPKNVLIAHGYEVWGPPWRPIPTWEKWVLGSMVDGVVAVSAYTRSRMARAYSIEPARFRVLPRSVDLPPLPDDRDVQGQVILTVGRLEDRYKGFDKVIMVLPEIVKEFPDVRYRIVGSGPLRAELAELARQVGVADRVEFLGRLTDAELAEAYRSARMFVLPSNCEGFGIVYLEAWAHGLPVIGGKFDASAEVIADGVNGLLVDPDSVEELAGAIKRLLADHDFACQLGRQGYETVLSNYTHEHFRRRLAAILKDVAHPCAE